MGKQTVREIVSGKLKKLVGTQVSFCQEGPGFSSLYLAPAKPLWTQEEMNSWLTNLGLPAPSSFRPCFASKERVHWAFANFRQFLGEKREIRTEEFVPAGSARKRRTRVRYKPQQVFEETWLKIYPSEQLAREICLQNCSYHQTTPSHPYSGSVPLKAFQKLGGVILALQEKPLPESLLRLQASPMSIMGDPKDRRGTSVSSPAGFTKAWMEPIYQESWQPTEQLLLTLHTQRLGNDTQTWTNLWQVNLACTKWRRGPDRQNERRNTFKDCDWDMRAVLLRWLTDCHFQEERKEFLITAWETLNTRLCENQADSFAPAND